MYSYWYTTPEHYVANVYQIYFQLFEQRIAVVNGYYVIRYNSLSIYLQCKNVLCQQVVTVLFL